MLYQFPPDFYWGSAASATQTEGAAALFGKGDNIWDHWYQREPNRFYQGVSPQNTSTFYQHYQDDIGLMKAINFNSF